LERDRDHLEGFLRPHNSQNTTVRRPSPEMATQDYYQTLEIQPTASVQEIKEAYRRLAFQYHPDRNANDPHAADHMKRINEAYAVLSNTTKRQEYDAYRNRFGQNAHQHFRTTYADNDIFSGSDIQDVFEEMAKAFGLRGFDAIFKETYGPNYRTFQVHRPGFFAKGFVFFGSPGKKVEGNPGQDLPQPLVRIGKYLFKKLIPGGRPEKGADIHDRIVLDSSHAQEGGPYAYFLRQKDKKLIVKIPKGVKDGQLIRLAKMGKPGKHGGEPGDAILKVKIKKSWIQRIKDSIDKK